MKEANPDVTTWDGFQYFAKLAIHVAEALVLQITKLHLGIQLHYDIFQLETRITSLKVSSSQMLLDLTSKDLVLENAKKIDILREKVLESYKSFLKLSNVDLKGFLECVFPQLSSSTVFDYSCSKPLYLMVILIPSCWHVH